MDRRGLRADRRDVHRCADAQELEQNGGMGSCGRSCVRYRRHCRLVYAVGPSTVTGQLYIRAMDGLEARPIPGTEGARYPFFSSDGQWVGFSAGGRLKKVSLSGGTVVSLADVNLGSFLGASWRSQGTIAFAPQLSGPILQISDSGGNPQPMTRLEKGEVGHGLPEFMPGGKGLLFLTSSLIGSGTGTNNTFAAQSLGTRDHRDLL